MTLPPVLDRVRLAKNGRRTTGLFAFYPMQKIQVTTKTSEQIAADFAVVFGAIKPVTPPKPLTQADRLAPYKKAILKQRRRGLSWRQIADGMADPRINEPVTEKLLRIVFGAKEKSAKAPAKTAAAAVPATPAKPARQRLILDPLTGLPVTSN